MPSMETTYHPDLMDAAKQAASAGGSLQMYFMGTFAAGATLSAKLDADAFRQYHDPPQFTLPGEAPQAAPRLRLVDAARTSRVEGITGDIVCLKTVRCGAACCVWH